jgi:hypothetical protein
MSSLIHDKRILTYVLVAVGLAVVAGVMVPPSVAYADGGDHHDHKDNHHHHKKHHRHHDRNDEDDEDP